MTLPATTTKPDSSAAIVASLAVWPIFGDLFAAAFRASDPVRPAAGDEIFPAIIGIFKVLDGLNQRLWQRVHAHKYECI